MDLWRISDYSTLDGKGALRASARWHKAGTRVVYFAACPPGALLEVLVHLELFDEEYLPIDYQLLRVQAPDALQVQLLLSEPDQGWIHDIDRTQRLGAEWLASRASVLARVPCAIMPATFNYLFNPMHPDASAVSIVDAVRTPFEERLLGGRR